MKWHAWTALELPMIASDVLILLALAVFLLAWWARGLRWRTALLFASLLVVFAAGIWGLANYRWQGGAGALVALLLLPLALFARGGGARKGGGVPWKSGIAVALLAGVAAAPLYLFPVRDLPPPGGPHAVGTRAFELVDISRRGVFAAGAAEPRRLLVRAWYPAGDVTGLPRRPYLSEAETKYTITGIGELFGLPFFAQYFSHGRSNAYEAAPLLAGAAQLPVVVFSHGYHAFAGQSSALMEALASRGYAVYSLQHTHDSAGTVFPDGGVVAADPAAAARSASTLEPSAADRAVLAGATPAERHAGIEAFAREARAQGHALVTQSAEVWLQDRIFLLDSLERGAVPGAVAELVAASDFRRTGQMGMSYGGSTTGAFCRVDARCAAGVNLDGRDFHLQGLKRSVPAPFMMLYSDFGILANMVGEDVGEPSMGYNDFSYERPELAGLREDVYRLMVRGATHAAYTDIPLFLRGWLRDLVTGPIDGATMIALQNDLVSGFFDTHLRGADVGFPAAQLRAYREHLRVIDSAALRGWWLDTHPRDATRQVTLQTAGGDVTLALYPRRSPEAVARLLSQVAAGDLDGRFLSRVAVGEGVQLALEGGADAVLDAGESRDPEFENGWGVVFLLPPTVEGGPARLFINLAREDGASPPARGIPLGRILGGGVALEALAREGRPLRVRRAVPAA
ncbi:hypothetical protein [Parahaliea mediterranea]|uniref:Dienelactone hydrolase n=1 Tax=Parahaliea mediterranea TaxID=651086 RepID=A0A939IKN7_9GAMM|nr:hypothetical protein [Parahaliea mediterranea]MBN7797521.1 hypothetical protein [Parahaliea mediterranea]